MGVAVEKVGTTCAEWTGVVDPDAALAYAAATNDDNPAYRAGACAPPVFAVVPTWRALAAALAEVVPPEAMPRVVHGEHDMRFFRPLAPGQVLVTAAGPHSVRAARFGTRCTVRAMSVDAADGAPVLEQFGTVVVRGVTGGEGAGPDKPDHAFPDEARRQPVGSHIVHVDDDQTHRYSVASGDRMPIHLDDAAARAVGLPGIVVHGLCTMAMTGRSVLATVAGGDPARLRRLAVRFSRPVFPGTDLVTTIYDAGPLDGGHAYAFEAHAGGKLVVADGRAEVAH